jgi:hypothetical protein
VESTVVEVLILNGLGDDCFYKMVNAVDGKIVGEFDGPQGGGASLSGAGTEADPENTKSL